MDWHDVEIVATVGTRGTQRKQQPNTNDHSSSVRYYNVQ